MLLVLANRTAAVALAEAKPRHRHHVGRCKPGLNAWARKRAQVCKSLFQAGNADLIATKQTAAPSRLPLETKLPSPWHRSAGARCDAPFLPTGPAIRAVFSPMSTTSNRPVSARHTSRPCLRSHRRTGGRRISHAACARSLAERPKPRFRRAEGKRFVHPDRYLIRRKKFSALTPS